jgi:hypothetical protein
VPVLRAARRWRDWQKEDKADAGSLRPPRRAPPVSGRCSAVPAQHSICRHFSWTRRVRQAVPRYCGGAPWCCPRQQKSRFPGIFSLAKPSDGLEPSTPSLPWSLGGNLSQPTATVFAYLGRSRRRPICDRLPPVAAALLHKCSMIRCPSWLRPGTNPTRRRSPVLPKTPVDRRGRGGPNDNPASRSARRRLG